MVSAEELYSKFRRAFNEVQVDDISLDADLRQGVEPINMMAEAFGDVVSELAKESPADNNDIELLSSLAGQYAQLANNNLENAKFVSIRTGDFEEGCGASNELRAERDFWTLLEMMSQANVLGKISDELVLPQDELCLGSSIPENMNAAFEANDIIKKGEILKQWLERSAADLVSVPSAPSGISQSDGLFEIEIPTIKGFELITTPAKWYSDDSELQEHLLKAIWQYIRSGQIECAQQLAFDHRVFWLAALLRGGDHFYYTAINDDINFITRMGNVRQPIWAKSCWNCSENLFQARSSDTSGVTLLEMTIYSALANNITVLNSSPLLSTWHDKVWCVVKAAHSRNIMLVLKQYRECKLRHSEYYPALQPGISEAENELFLKLERMIGDVSLASCNEVFSRVPSPAGLQAETLLIDLQAAFMAGYEGFKSYLENKATKLINKKDNFPGKKVYLRVLSHLFLWIDFAPSHFADNLRSLVCRKLFHQVVEAYIDQLIADQLYTLVAMYCKFLSHSRRVFKFCDLLMKLQGKNVESQERVEVLKHGNQYFPSDMIDVFRSVVQRTKANDCAQQFFPKGDHNMTVATMWNSPCSKDSEALDLMRVESIKWFTLLNNNQFESLLQINKFVVSIVVESGFNKFGMVSNVLKLCLPELTQFSTSDSKVEAYWHNSMDKIALWKKLIVVLDYVRQWSDQYQKFRSIKPEMFIVKSGLALLSDKLKKLSRDSLTSIENCLRFESSGVDGFVMLWDNSQTATLDVMDQIISDVLPAIMDVSLRDAISRISKKTSNREVLAELQSILLDLEKALIDDDSLFGIWTSLRRYYILVEGVVLEAEFSSSCLFAIIQTYFEICIKTAECLDGNDAGEFYLAAVSFCEMVVSEDSSLRLYSHLQLDQLEKILENANEAMISLLKFNPDAMDC